MQAAQQEARNAIHQLPDNTDMDEIRSMYPLPSPSFRRRLESSGLLHTFPPSGNDNRVPQGASE